MLSCIEIVYMWANTGIEYS